MFKKSFLLLLIFMMSQFACAEKMTSSIPLAINHVQTQRVADSVIRIIKYNMEETPRFEIERLETPKFKLAERIIITKLKVGKRWIDFKNSAGTFIDGMGFKKGIFYFTVEHFFAGTSGGEIILKCKIDTNNNKLSKPVCIEQ
jgi:hypothetical protein